MDEVSYFGYYTTQIGSAAKYVVTTPQKEPIFPSGIMYKDKNYRLVKYFRVASQGLLVKFYAWADSQNIETDIKLNP
jgi:hypothetical protein